jgi:acetolactate synthase-1/2/3 large subunit
VLSAQSDGFEFAERLTDKTQLQKTIKEFIDCKTAAFLEVIIDPDAMVFPMVGPGMSYDQKITGEHIKSRNEDPEVEPIDPKAMF